MNALIGGKVALFRIRDAADASIAGASVAFAVRAVNGGSAVLEWSADGVRHPVVRGDQQAVSGVLPSVETLFQKMVLARPWCAIVRGIQ